MGGWVVANGCGRATPVGSTGWRLSATLSLKESEQARTPSAGETHLSQEREGPVSRALPGMVGVAAIRRPATLPEPQRPGLGLWPQT